VRWINENAGISCQYNPIALILDPPEKAWLSIVTRGAHMKVFNIKYGGMRFDGINQENILFTRHQVPSLMISHSNGRSWKLWKLWTIEVDDPKSKW
jgi:hypothetical protein